jgi:tetratricopeptide (TPR) repeat protein
MGVVYAAYDPELDRKLAIKLVRPAASATEDQRARHARLLREAQAMAKLSHPNVIAVHDVGSFEDQVFVAMELVAGCTLTEWRAREERTLPEILDAYLQAGRGLAACHRAGLVHRDFKPDNVLMGDDGRVRVLDFGLARSDESAGPVSGERAPLGGEASTVTGALVGTPAYMSPEQRARLQVDARSDQYSYCVALHEAIVGERPGETYARRRELPAWLARVLERGLRADPAQRYPSVDDLLVEIGRDPRAARRVRYATLAAVVLLVGSVFGVRAVFGQRASQCRGADRKLGVVWDAKRRDALLARATQLAGPYGAGVTKRAADLLDGFARGWRASHTEACEATLVRGEQSEALLDLRVQCLDEKLEDLRATARLLGEADRDTTLRAVQLTAALPSLVECGDAAHLLRLRPEPKGAKVVQLEAQIADLRVLGRAGQHQRVHAGAPALVERAHALGSARLEASALEMLSVAENQLGLDDQAAASAFAAVLAAERASDDRQLPVARIRYAQALSRKGMNAEALRWLDLADTALGHPGADVGTQRRGLTVRALALRGLGHASEGLAAMERSLALARDTLRADEPELAWAHMNLGAFLEGADDARALDEDMKAYAIAEAAYGESHPDVRALMTNIGNMLIAAGRPRDARPWIERAFDADLKAFGPKDRRIEASRHDLAVLLANNDDFAGAIAQDEEVLRLIEARGGEHEPWTAYPLLQMGYTYLDLHRPKDALVVLERAMKLPPRDRPHRGDVAFPLAQAVWETSHDRTRITSLLALARGDIDASSGGGREEQKTIDEWERDHLRAPQR